MRLCRISALASFVSLVLSLDDGPDYEELPLETIFPGPWENNIRAPVNKSCIVPVKIFNHEGSILGAESMLQGPRVKSKSPWWVIGPGGLVTFEFQENIPGR